MDIIRLGDSTSHGGVVIEAFNQTDLNGKPMAGVGHKVTCPSMQRCVPYCRGQCLAGCRRCSRGAPWNENRLWRQPDRQRAQRRRRELVR